MKPVVAVVGPGRVGQTVARLLHQAGYHLQAILSRDSGRAAVAASFAGCPEAATTDPARLRQAAVVLLALPDDHLAETARTLREQAALAEEAVLVHFSGIHPAAILLQDNQAPAGALALHPLQTFANPEAGLAALPGSPWSVEGNAADLELGERLVRDLGGKPFRLQAMQKPLYHAAASVVSNQLAALVKSAAQIMTGCGFSERESLALLGPLFRTSADNILALGPEQALTGPIARGDVRTVARHLQALADQPSELIEIYRVLGCKTVEVALAKGSLGESAAREILRLLDS